MKGKFSSPPIFIVGVPRSGTTLLATILGAHPRIVSGHETHFFGDSFSEGIAREIVQDPHWPSRAIDYLLTIPVTDTSVRPLHGLSREELTAALAARRPSISSVLSGLMELRLASQGGLRWCEKTPDHLPHVARIRRHYPDSPIIRIVRDPRAVAASLLRLPWGPRSLLAALCLYRGYENRSARFFETDPGSHTVRYEDLLHDAESTAKQLCHVIGEPFDPMMLDTAESAKLMNPLDHPWKTRAAQPIDATRAESWREAFLDDDLRLTDAMLGDVIRAHGYPAPFYDLPHRVDAYSVRRLYQYPEIAADLVNRGGRFWKAPDEECELGLLLGHPDQWNWEISISSQVQSLARLVLHVVRLRAAGVSLTWFRVEGEGEFHGLGLRALARLLPRAEKSEDIPRFSGRRRHVQRRTPPTVKGSTRPVNATAPKLNSCTINRPGDGDPESVSPNGNPELGGLQ